MRRIGFTAFIALAIGTMIPVAQAGPWGNILQLPSTNIRMIDDSRSPASNPVPATYSGNIVSFEISYRDQSGEAECRATVESEGRGFNARFVSTLQMRDDDPRMPITLMRQTAACLSAQRAYLRSQPVAIIGMPQPGGVPAINGMGNLTVINFTQSTESSLAGGTPATANVCTQIGCQAQASVANISYHLSDDLNLCTAVLKIKQADQSERFATANVQLSPEFCRKETCNGKDLKLAQAHLQACQLFEAALDADRTVTVLGYGQGSEIRNVVSVTVDDSPLPAMTTMF